ncbi:hypothetical protein IVB11_36640 [Bradyrhizobium sp. 177]|uniref:hypothetical protein n=1 Tax=Bradyrhizobium sp. 177 TaxID=2782647 RepID=UPI001FFC02A7|nr:hypothetical protein [Bradyrhizobium sp. 177]MCK1554439.1 hypothetical protein [Bradyrhizobium sp. 177]
MKTLIGLIATALVTVVTVLGGTIHSFAFDPRGQTNAVASSGATTTVNTAAHQEASSPATIPSASSPQVNSAANNRAAKESLSPAQVPEANAAKSEVSSSTQDFVRLSIEQLSAEVASPEFKIGRFEVRGVITGKDPDVKDPNNSGYIEISEGGSRALVMIVGGWLSYAYSSLQIGQTISVQGAGAPFSCKTGSSMQQCNYFRLTQTVPILFPALIRSSTASYQSRFP